MCEAADAPRKDSLVTPHRFKLLFVVICRVCGEGMWIMMSETFISDLMPHARLEHSRYIFFYIYFIFHIFAFKKFHVGPDFSVCTLFSQLPMFIDISIIFGRCTAKNGLLGIVKVAVVSSRVHRCEIPCIITEKVWHWEAPIFHAWVWIQPCWSSVESGRVPPMTSWLAIATISVMPSVKGLVWIKCHVSGYSLCFFSCEQESLLWRSVSNFRDCVFLKEPSRVQF